MIVALCMMVLENEYESGSELVVLLDLPLWCILIAFTRADGLVFGAYKLFPVLVVFGTVMWMGLGYVIGARFSTRPNGDGL